MREGCEPGGRVLLADRGVVSVAGRDSGKLLQGLLTTDVDDLQPGRARLAALLTPQGKILFELLVVRTDDGFVLETSAQKTGDLIKRLMLYKLRADVAFIDQGESRRVVATWGDASPPVGGLLTYDDPRHGELGRRTHIPAERAAEHDIDRTAYDARRIARGIGEGDRDYPLGDTFPHEANFDLLGGVSFTKGCFVGQEVVARMQHKTIVRKRVIRLSAADSVTPLASGNPVSVGSAEIGTVGSVCGTRGLALVRLDRVTEALDKGQATTAGDVPVTVEAEAVARYRADLEQRRAAGA